MSAAWPVPRVLAGSGRVMKLIIPRGFIQPSHDRVLWRDGREEAYACLVSLYPDHPHRKPLARRQFDGYALMGSDARCAIKFEAMLRVVDDVDATGPAVGMQNRPDTHGMPGLAWLANAVPRGSLVVGHSVPVSAHLDSPARPRPPAHDVLSGFGR